MGDVMDKANINSITRLRINEDGPGVRSVIFMCGCPLNCVWCCNPEICLSKSFKTLSVDELYGYISNDVPYFVNSGGGVTFSGGEPLLHTDYIKRFIDKYCSNFSVALETSLYTDISNVEILYPLIDRWYIDFKVFDEKKHIEYTGVSNEAIKSNLNFLSRNIDKDKITITYPMIPGFNTSEDNLYDMMTFLSELGIKYIELHPYRKFQEQKHKDVGLEPTAIDEISNELYGTIKYNFLNNGFVIPERSVYREKGKCKYLKAIRKEICIDKNIPLEIKDCTFEGRCVGTCPQCEYELEFINRNIKEETL